MILVSEFFAVQRTYGDEPIVLAINNDEQAHIGTIRVRRQGQD